MKSYGVPNVFANVFSAPASWSVPLATLCTSCPLSLPRKIFWVGRLGRFIRQLRNAADQFLLEAVLKPFSLVCLAIFESPKLALLRTFGKNGQNWVVKEFWNSFLTEKGLLAYYPGKISYRERLVPWLWCSRIGLRGNIIILLSHVLKKAWRWSFYVLFFLLKLFFKQRSRQRSNHDKRTYRWNGFYNTQEDPDK